MEYEDNLNYQGSTVESGRHTILSLRKASVQIPLSDKKNNVDKNPNQKQKATNSTYSKPKTP